MPAYGGVIGQALRGVTEPRAALYRPVRDSRKPVQAVWLGTC